MTRQKWFKILLWVWLGSIPFMFAMAMLGDWGQQVARPFPPAAAPMDQLQAFTNTPDPLWVICLRMLQILAGLYMFLGWIPVVIFGFLKEAKPTQAT